VSTPIVLELHEWERRRPEGKPDDPLAGRRIESAADRALCERLARERRLIVRELAHGLEIETTSHVGRIHLGPLRITIAPKLGGDRLVRLLRYAYGLRNLHLVGEARFGQDGALLEDLVAKQLYAEARELWSRGLDRRYVTVAEELGSPRGRIDMNALARRIGPPRSTLPCGHHVRREDSALNRALLAGLRLGARVADDWGIAASITRLADTLAVDVRDVPPSTSLLSRARGSLDRLSAAYEPALSLVALLFEGVAPALDDAGEPAIALPGFLFDMNHFFQALLDRFLKENLHECEVRSEQRLCDMMLYAPEENPRGRRPPRPRPDFIVIGPDGSRAILDAKYRDLWQHELPREMLYQLAIYALSGADGGTATILYPTVARGARRARIEIREPLRGGTRASVLLQPVDLEELDAAIGAGDTTSGRQARREMARRVALG
jgi:5-methylcytosine-specific restriction enzyme subunit McrC